MEFSPRPATPDDLPALLEIEQRIQVLPWTAEHFAGELQKPYSHVLILTDDESDQTIGGYIVFWTLSEESQILNLGVDLPHRGLGFAARLLQKCISLSIDAGAKKIQLEVRKSNEAALQLYQKIGFMITHIRKEFYSNKEDAYHMTLELEGEANPI